MKAQRVMAALAWTVITGLLVAASLVLHLATALGRAAASDLTEELVDSRIRGTLRIGGITRLDLGGFEMRSVRVTARSGERVMSADRLRARFALSESLWSGAIVLTGCELVGGALQLTPGPAGQIALVDALEVASDRAMVPVEFRDLRLRGVSMHIALAGMPFEVDMRDVAGTIEMTLGHRLSARMHGLHGSVHLLVANVGFQRFSGRLRGGDREPLVARMVLDLDIADPGMAFVYSAPGVVGEDGAARARIELADGVQ